MCPAQPASKFASSGASSDVVVVGAGVIGLLTAVELRQRGLSVTVLEAAAACRESSWAGGGILVPIMPWHYPEPIWDLGRRSLELYPALVSDLLEHTGVDAELTRSGLLIPDSSQEAEARHWCEREGLEIEKGEQGLRFPWVHQVRNPRLGRALVLRAQQLGIRLLEHRAVVDFERQGHRISAVITEAERLPAGRVVLAAGAWSGELAERVGLSLPVVPVRGQMLLLRPMPGRLREIILHAGRYLIPRRDGRILVGSTVERVGFNKRTTASERSSLLDFAREQLPEVEAGDVETYWAGLRPGSADGLPYVGPLLEFDGLYVNAGHYRNGLVMGPASAELMADLLTVQATKVAAAAYRFDR